MDEQGYAGPATLAIGTESYAVQVGLRGAFQPIDGRFHWYGRIAAHEELAAALGPARVAGTLTTPEGSAACEVSDPDPWQRYRVTGRSTPPFAVSTDLPPQQDEGGAAALDARACAQQRRGRGRGLPDLDRHRHGAGRGRRRGAGPAPDPAALAGHGCRG